MTGNIEDAEEKLPKARDDAERVLIALYCMTDGDHTIQGIYVWLCLRGYELGGDRIKEALERLKTKGLVAKGHYD